MKRDTRIPAFITSFVEAERALALRPTQPHQLLQGAYVLFRAYEMLLYEILSSAGVEIQHGWSLRKASLEVVAQAGLGPNFDRELRELLEHRNMIAHARPVSDFTADVFVEDLGKVRRLAIWYLQHYSEGPRLSARAATALLKGSDITLPKAVFVSYASEDQAKANSLYDALRNRGHKPWMDKRDLIGGQDWETEIRKAIQKADYFVALMSRNSVTKRGFVQKEIRFALDVLGEIPPGRIYFIPARLEPCEVPDTIRRLHWVDLEKDSEYLQVFKAIEHA